MNHERVSAARVDVSVIFVNWNSEDDLCECIRSIHANSGVTSYEIIVVDNASPAKRVPELKSKFPEVRFVESNANIGFAGANNLGFQRSGGACALFLNPDTKFLGPVVDVLYAALQQLPNAGAVGGKLMNADLSVQTSAIQKFPTIFNQIWDVEYLRLLWPQCRLWGIGPLFSERGPVAVEMISGACVMLRRETFARLGMFSEDYFMYAEDLDLCYRLAHAGLTNYYIPEAVLIHYGGTSSRKHQFRQWPAVMKYRALFRFQEKHRGVLYAVAFRTCIAFSALGRLCLLSLAGLFRTNPSSRESLSILSAKWRTILKCALGTWNENPPAARPDRVIPTQVNSGNCG